MLLGLKFSKEKATYIGLPIDTHSNLKYCPSWGIISECVISRWGASVEKGQQVCNAITVLYDRGFNSNTAKHLSR